MTHSLHRRGNRKSLEGDYIIFTNDRPLEDVEKNEKLNIILARHNPAGACTETRIDGKRKRLRYIKGWNKNQSSGLHESYTLEEIRNAKKVTRWGSVYRNREDVKKTIKDIVDAELGISIVVSGLFDEVRDMCIKAGTMAHTVNMSCETLGKTSLLAEPKILEFTTMCGHSFISPNLVIHLINRVKRGTMGAEDASIEMAKQCTCNWFNVDRASKLINEYIKANK